MPFYSGHHYIRCRSGVYAFILILRHIRAQRSNALEHPLMRYDARFADNKTAPQKKPSVARTRKKNSPRTRCNTGSLPNPLRTNVRRLESSRYYAAFFSVFASSTSIFIFFGSASTLVGIVNSRTPFLYTACTPVESTPSGRDMLRSNAP